MEVQGSCLINNANPLDEGLWKDLCIFFGGWRYSTILFSHFLKCFSYFETIYLSRAIFELSLILWNFFLVGSIYLGHFLWFFFLRPNFIYVLILVFLIFWFSFTPFGHKWSCSWVLWSFAYFMVFIIYFFTFFKVFLFFDYPYLAFFSLVLFMFSIKFPSNF